MRIGKQKIKREPGYLYYIGVDGHVWRSPMATNPTGRKERIGTEEFHRAPGYMYYMDKDGYVAKARMKDVAPGVRDSRQVFVRGHVVMKRGRLYWVRSHRRHR
jgi:hypothetical protein